MYLSNTHFKPGLTTDKVVLLQYLQSNFLSVQKRGRKWWLGYWSESLIMLAALAVAVGRCNTVGINVASWRNKPRSGDTANS